MKIIEDPTRNSTSSARWRSLPAGTTAAVTSVGTAVPALARIRPISAPSRDTYITTTVMASGTIRSAFSTPERPPCIPIDPPFLHRAEAREL